MKKEVGRIMALCDTEEEYVRLMLEFLKQHKNLPWEPHGYTSAEDLLREEKGALELLVVSEAAFCRDMESLSPRQLVVLNESGIMQWEDVIYVDKYQAAEEVLKQLLGAYMEVADIRLPKLSTNRKAVLIGNFSPVKRSLQTSFAITMSQLLAREHATLYLNFEHYAGLSELLPDMQTLDLADLLYFLGAEKEKFRLRMRTMLRHMGGLAYIPPMKSGQNLLAVTGEEWLELLQKIAELEEYEYIVLDLGESMQGLFDILRQCDRVYTLTREDRMAKMKLFQYEQVLALYEYRDVLEKTERLCLSHIRSLPEEMEKLTKGDLADVVRELMKRMGEPGKEDEWSTRN